MAKKEVKIERNAALEAIDAQIVLLREELRIITEDPVKGPKCDEYEQVQGQLTKLLEARKDLAISEGVLIKAEKEGLREKLSWNTVLPVVGNLAVAGLMFFFEREHVLPKSAMKFFQDLKGGIKFR